MRPRGRSNRRFDQLTTGLARRNVTALDSAHRVLVYALLAAALYAMVTAGLGFTGIPFLDEARSAERHAAAAGAKPLVMPFALLLVAAHRTSAENTKAATS